MKNLILIVSLFISTNYFAQTKSEVTATITVKGNCGECKERIEKAAYIKGVKHVEWNKETKIATIVYNSEKTSLDKIEQAIAAKGHETTHFPADEKQYNRLPDCCQYKKGKCEKD